MISTIAQKIDCEDLFKFLKKEELKTGDVLYRLLDFEQQIRELVVKGDYLVKHKNMLGLETGCYKPRNTTEINNNP